MNLRGNKYRARKVHKHGITFDSQKEANRYEQLQLLVRAGLIRDLQVHPRFSFDFNGRPLLYSSGRKVTYKPDFGYFDVWTGQRVVEDVKGGEPTKTAEYKLKRAIFEANYPDIRFVEIG